MATNEEIDLGAMPMTESLKTLISELGELDGVIKTMTDARKVLIGTIEFAAHQLRVRDWTSGVDGYRIQLVEKLEVSKENLPKLQAIYPDAVKVSLSLDRTNFTPFWNSGETSRKLIADLVDMNETWVIAKETRKTAKSVEV